MNRLAFDTATNACSVAIERADGERFEIRPPGTRLLGQPAHTTELLPAIAQLARSAGLAIGDFEQIIVGVGPGAFTGLRIGVATARAIATANQAGLIGASSLAALAADGSTPLIDARRGEIYLRPADEDLLTAPDEAVALAAAAGRPAVGDGAIKLRAELEAAGVAVAPDEDSAHVLSAIALLEFAEGVVPEAPDAVVPNYIRPPDAKVSSRESWLVGGKR